MSDTERKGGAALSLVPPQATPSEPAPAAPAEAAPKRRGRPPGSKNKTAGRPVPAKKAKKKAERKAQETSREKTAQQLRRVRSTDLKKREAAGDPNAGAQLKKIHRTYAAWNKAKAHKAETGKLCGERLKAVDAALQNAVEAPLDATKVETLAYKTKLENIEIRWQERSETIAGNIEARKDAAADLKKAFALFSKAVDNTDQQDLPGIS